MNRPHSACGSGVWGYRVPKSQLLSEGPKYSFPKDHSSNPIEAAQRESKKNPGPG
jgi:hypothetical protein